MCAYTILKLRLFMRLKVWHNQLLQLIIYIVITLGAHPMDVVSAVTWINDTTVASCGYDVCIRIWELSG